MTEAAASADPNDNPPMAHQSKKKRIEDQPLPPDIGLKPVQLQRRRVWRACESCRRKKIKCDGNEPTCSQCAASKSQCTWLQTKDRAALSRHYVQELEARLLHMESLFQQITPILEQVGEASGLDLSSISPPLAPSQPGAPTIPPNLLQSVLPKIKDVARNGAVTDGTGADVPIKLEDDVSESFGQLALDEHGHMHWIGGSSTMSLIQSFREITSSPLHRISPMEEDPLAPGPSVNKLYFPASVFFGKVHALPHPEEVEYPDRDLADKLVDAYFARFHFLMPVIDKPSFMLRYKYLMDHTNDPRLARAETAFIALVCAVFAVAAKFVDDPRLSKAENLDDGGMGMVYYERALILHYISHVSSQIEHAWLLVGQAVRTAQDLGLHRSPRRLLVTPIEKETRRKIWWGVYTLDRMLALALGRPLAIEDADCDVELPVDVDDENLQDYFNGAQMSRLPPSLMKGFVELTLLYRIGGQVLRQVYALDKCKDHLESEKRAELQRAVESLDMRLTKWCDDLPPAFKSAPVNERQVSMGAVLCSHYYSILTTLHRNFLPLKRDQTVSPRSTVKAVSTARACIRLAPSIKNVVPPSHHLAFFIQNLFSSAVIILLYAMHCVDPAASAAAMDEVSSCLAVLGSWEGHWPGARKCKELLDDLAATACEAIKASAHGGSASGGAQGRGTGSTSSASASPSSVMSDGWGPGQIPLPVPERLMKNRPRRNRSRDVRDVRLASPHSPSAIQFRPDSQRARSSSRKRPHDDDGFDSGSAYASVLPSSYPGRSRLLSTHSTHSSPASVNSHPSPSGAPIDFQDPSPRIVTSNSYGALNGPASPPIPTPSQPRFDYDFGLSHSPTESWGVPPLPGDNAHGRGNGLKLFPAGATQGAYAFVPPQSPADTAFGYTYGGDSASSDPSMSLFGPPSSGFAAPGLPFRGLDYIRNFNPGYTLGEQDQLWHTLDPGVFGYDPEIPFTLGDISTDGRWSDGQ